MRQFWGTSNNDAMTGTAYDDRIDGLDGDDRVNGAGGNDQLYGERGNDSLIGGLGNDQLHGGDGNDWLGDPYGGNEAGNDSMWGDAGSDQLFGGDGNDWLNGGTGDDIVKGMRGDDTMIGGAGNDTLYDSYRDGGADLFQPGTGNDLMVSYTDGQVDRFLMEQAPGGFGQDTINYFEKGVDQIEFHGYAAWETGMTSSGSTSVFTFTDGSSLTVDQIGLSAGHDFIFT